MDPVVLIMTATIAPPSNAPGVTRLDPALRLQDYERALTFYLDHLGDGFDRICFAENSGSDVASLRALVSARGASNCVHFTDSSSLKFPPNYGRCYGETALLDRAMMELTETDCGADAIFWKVTGRYKVLNIRRMIRSRPAQADLYMDLRSRGGQCWADLRLMSWTFKGYEQIMRGIAPFIREDDNDSRPGEETAFNVLQARIAEADAKAVTSFTSEPLIDGIRAFDEKNWMAGRQRAVYHARNLQRTLLGRVYL